MMRINDFQKYEITLSISYEDYFKLIYESKHLLEARLGCNRTFIAKKPIYGNSRRRAVQKAVQWFWKDFKGILGSAHKIMTIDDPYNEVVYHDGFACNDLGNKYLEQGVILKLIEQSNGELAQDDSEGSANHPPNSVKRIKRRRREKVEIAPGVFRTHGGTLYFRMKNLSDGKNRRSKNKSVKLSSKSLDKALREVSRRGLDNFSSK
jgi:hypothetical protein